METVALLQCFHPAAGSSQYLFQSSVVHVLKTKSRIFETTIVLVFTALPFCRSERNNVFRAYCPAYFLKQMKTKGEGSSRNATEKITSPDPRTPPVTVQSPAAPSKKSPSKPSLRQLAKTPPPIPAGLVLPESRFDYGIREGEEKCLSHSSMNTKPNKPQ